MTNDELTRTANAIIDRMINDFARTIDLRTDHDANCITDLHTMMRALINDDFAPIIAIESTETLDIDASIECAIETIAFNMISRCFVITDPDHMIELIDDLHRSLMNELAANHARFMNR